MTWVKVCGLTRESDVSDAVDAGADALGFVLAARSPRRISVERAAALMSGVPALRILVTVDASRDMIAAMVEATGADGIQPHGRHAETTALWAQQAGLLVLRPIGDGDAGRIPEGQIPLFDSATGDLHGGTGVPLDWEAIDRPERRFVLAGGLNAENVADAVAAVHPWGVDASSGLESAPGIKDVARVAAFVEEAKRT
ncbi:MAG: phosphoribosylanthranilate isomerase [Actinomycetota bacterium]|nr:phosphoribosylanthranilate isomerase [Actinomycetota bacterium]